MSAPGIKITGFNGTSNRLIGGEAVRKLYTGINLKRPKTPVCAGEGSPDASGALPWGPGVEVRRRVGR